MTEAAIAGSKVGMRDFIQLMNSPGRLAWLNIYAGFMRGIGGVIGAAVAILAIGLAVNYLGGIPVIGKFISNLAAATGQVYPQ